MKKQEKETDIFDHLVKLFEETIKDEVMKDELIEQARILGCSYAFALSEED
jgi:hypothetical protein